MKTDIKLQFASDPRLLETVRATTRAYLQRLDQGAERIQEVVLAVDEACANAMRHAYVGRTDGMVSLRFSRTGNYLDILVIDKGIPISSAALHPGLEKRPNKKPPKPGGLGLKLMHRIFDKVTITPGKKQGNRIRLRLRLE